MPVLESVPTVRDPWSLTIVWISSAVWVPLLSVTTACAAYACTPEFMSWCTWTVARERDPGSVCWDMSLASPDKWWVCPEVWSVPLSERLDTVTSPDEGDAYTLYITGIWLACEDDSIMDEGTTFPRETTLPSWLVAIGTTTVPTDCKLLPCDPDEWSTLCSWVWLVSWTIGKVMVLDDVVGLTAFTWTVWLWGCCTRWICTAGCVKTCPGWKILKYEIMVRKMGQLRVNAHVGDNNWSPFIRMRQQQRESFHLLTRWNPMLGYTSC